MSITYSAEAAQTPLSGVVAAANNLTARWCAFTAARNFAVSGACVWPLLGLLASAATGRSRVELSRAIGRSAETAQTDATMLIRRLRDSQDAAMAMGIWVPAGVRIQDQAWADALPAGVLAAWTDPDQLDSWTAAQTRGMITEFPMRPDPMSRLVLASALAVQTRWTLPFAATRLRPTDGPWTDRALAGLTRSSVDIHDITALDGPVSVTRAIVAGADDVDVHLLLGADGAEPDQVLGTGLAALGGGIPVRLGCELTIGSDIAGVTVEIVDSTRTELDLTVPAFDISSEQDLCAEPALFGLNSAMSTAGGQFPTLDEQLYVSCAGQNVKACFDGAGFHAAALSSTLMTSPAIPGPGLGHNVRITAVFDRPFGFLAVHRPTGLALLAGWVAQP